MSWADPLVVIPGGLLALLVLARLARLRPGLRPLVGPFALFVAVLGGLTLFTGGPLPASPWLALLFLLPLLTLVVRGNVIAFQWLFQRRHGASPPSLLDSVISVAFYGVGLGAVAHYWFKLELTPFLATSAVVGAVVVLPSIRIVGYQDWAMRYEVRYLFGSYEDYRVIEGDIYRLIWYHLRRAGIEFALPISNVVVHQTPAGARAEDAADRLLSALRGIDLFHLLSDAELHTLASRLRPQHYAAGEKIIEEGAAGDSLFLVDRGEVRVLRRLGGTPREIARLGEGECFGEMAMLTGQQRTATVVASTDVDVFLIDKASFQDILAGNPDMAVDISALLARRRAALHDAEADVTTRIRAGAGAGEGDLRQRILDRIRSSFGL